LSFIARFHRRQESSMSKKRKSFGLWSSPLSSKSLAGEVRLSDVQWAGPGQGLVWLEGRDGRGVLVTASDDAAPRDINDVLSVRGGVGYGGGEFTVFEDEVYFTANDGRLYMVHLDRGLPRAITPGFGRAASPAVSPEGDWVAYVHTHEGVDCIAVVDTVGKRWPLKLVSGADFYMQPAWSPGNTRMAWIAWDQPQMPWNGTRLETAVVHMTSKGITMGEREVWVGGEDVAVQQPSFSPDGRYLAYLSDASGFWHLYVREVGAGKTWQLTDGEVEYGGPAWIQGQRYYGWHPDEDRLWAVRNDRGVQTLVEVELDGHVEELPGLEAYTSVSQPSISATGDLVFVGASSQFPPRIVTWKAGTVRVERYGSSERVETSALSKMKPVSWACGDDSTTIFGNYYAPTNPDYECTGLPPALIMIHGGPTSQRTAAYDVRNQFFATRGFAVLDVNYRGSTGYGRAYMNALEGNWGIFDVEDAVSGAKYLVDAGLADPNKLVIMGGSAGGYTVLQALVTHPGVFAAGICLYGISDLFALARGTHKFEAAYNDRLIGPLPEAAEIYRARSPLFHAHQIVDPVAIFHGALDEVVPLDQAEAIVKSLKQRGVPHLYHVYQDEGHGWRRAENIEHFYDAALTFLNDHVVYR
jgi:dipeptidyl aminopeptidase/acylaminoacyl peptidase